MKDNFDYKEDLRKRLPELKKIEGFPIGDDEDILALSNPPFYTACPNPYINEFIEKYGKPYNEETDNYHREPFIDDVSEGKSDVIYTAHGYHTKVPYKAIKKYIEHYSQVGDLIIDSFSGTGMTGVAAQSLNRKTILSDLSPLATLISHIYNSKVEPSYFEKFSKEFLLEIESECGWMYETKHPQKTDINDNQKNLFDEKTNVGKINYTVWSDVFICPFCRNEYVFFNEAFNAENKLVSSEYNCPSCQAQITKKNSERAFNQYYDEVLVQTIQQAKQVPVLLNYNYNGETFSKKLDNYDINLIDKISNIKIPYWFPTERMPEGDESRRNDKMGITHVHHYFTKRSLYTLSAVYNKLSSNKYAKELFLRYTFEQAILGFAKISRYVPSHFSQVNQYLSGTLYIGSQIVEISLPYILSGKIERLIKAFSVLSSNINENTIVTTQSATDLSNIGNATIDYIFTDPPFGENLMYSELNFLHEIWNKLRTNNIQEAIINKTQQKDLSSYQSLMLKTFKEYYRLLKPKRWITVEFHNSKSSVWNAIQEAMIKSGFVIAQVSVLDKKQGSFKQITASGAVKSDLVISAYKPSGKFESVFLKEAGRGLELDFIQEFLQQQPKRPILERTEKMLYSKMLSYYVQHGYEVRYDAKAFYKLLRENLAEEDGYWFNANQINSYLEYKKKMKLEGIDDVKHGDILMFVMDEKSALVWLHNFMNKPKSFSDIHTAFTQLANIQGDEVPDLKDLLEQNFIADNGLYRRPKTEPEHNQVIDRRERQLLRQFESLLIQAQSEKKKIKSIRKEAVLLGFEYCYKEKRFQDILNLAKKLDNTILEENAELNEFVDAAEIMVSGLH